MRFPPIELRADIPRIERSDHVRNAFLLDDEVQVRVLAANEAPIRNPGKQGSFVGNDQNLSGVE